MEALNALDEVEVMELSAEECEDANPETRGGSTGEISDAELVAKARPRKWSSCGKSSCSSW